MWTPTEAQLSAWEALRAREHDVARQLAEWLEREGIAKDELASHVADTLAEDPTLRHLFETNPGSRVLRDAAIGVADLASMDPAELAAEHYWHGHDPY